MAAVCRLLGGSGGPAGIDSGGVDDFIGKKTHEFDATADDGNHARRLACGCLFVCLYVCIVLGGVIVVAMAINDVIYSYNNPITSIKRNVVDNYSAPAIVLFPNGNRFLACGHYYNNVVGAKLRTSELDLTSKRCTFEDVTYVDPIDNETVRQAVVLKGPTDVHRLEALFVYLSGEDETKDFFTVTYYVLPRWEHFNQSDAVARQVALSQNHGKMPTYALSAEMRTWVKLSKAEAYLIGEYEPKTQFNIEMSVIKYFGSKLGNSHPFFLFFEWKNNVVEQSFQLYATTPWNLAASMCGVVLALYKSTMFLIELRKRLLTVKQDAKNAIPIRRKGSAGDLKGCIRFGNQSDTGSTRT